jgi:hypothetical protein
VVRREESRLNVSVDVGGDDLEVPGNQDPVDRRSRIHAAIAVERACVYFLNAPLAEDIAQHAAASQPPVRRRVFVRVEVAGHDDRQTTPGPLNPFSNNLR